MSAHEWSVGPVRRIMTVDPLIRERKVLFFTLHQTLKRSNNGCSKKGSGHRNRIRSTEWSTRVPKENVIHTTIETDPEKEIPGEGYTSPECCKVITNIPM